MARMDLQLLGYRLTTAEILYRLPDHPALLQTFIWQELDIAPRFPVLHKFLSFWQRELEGKREEVSRAKLGTGPPGLLMRDRDSESPARRVPAIPRGLLRTARPPQGPPRTAAIPHGGLLASGESASGSRRRRSRSVPGEATPSPARESPGPRAAR